MGILVIGSSNTDLIAKAKSLPKPGETVLGGAFCTAQGGKGANQAVAAARLGADVTFMCKLGHDDFGEAARDGFVKEGIDTRYVLTSDTLPSGVALISIDEHAENCIIVASGSNAELSCADVDRIVDFGAYDVVLVQLETPMATVEHIGQLAAEKGVKFILNPAPAAPLSADLLKTVTVLTPNETEAGSISGVEVVDDETAIKAAAAIVAMGVDKVIMTLGSRGSLVYDGKSANFVPAFKVNAVDTTAAGDVFNAGLAVGLSEGKSLIDSVKLATASSAISVTRLGAQPSAPRRSEVEEFIKNNIKNN